MYLKRVYQHPAASHVASLRPATHCCWPHIWVGCLFANLIYSVDLSRIYSIIFCFTKVDYGIGNLQYCSTVIEAPPSVDVFSPQTLVREKWAFNISTVCPLMTIIRHIRYYCECYHLDGSFFFWVSFYSS